MSTPPPPATGTLCPNCYAQRVPAARYCHHCGQSVWDRTPTMRQMAHEYGQQYAGVEGALWRTLKLLLLKPGALTVEYLRGRRRHYLHPLRLYLTTSIVCFLLLQLVTAIQLNDRGATDQIAQAARNSPSSTISIDLGAGRAVIKPDGSFECTLGRFLCDRIRHRYAVDPARLGVEMTALSQRFITYLPYAMFVLLPLFALLLQLVYRGRRMHYAEHLVFALHLHAFWFCALWLLSLVPTALADLAMLFVLAYGPLAMHRVYRGRKRWTVARALLVSVLYLAAMLPMMAAVGLAALLV